MNLTGFNRFARHSLDNIVKGRHVDGIIIRRTSKVALPGSRFISDGDTEATTNAFVDTNGADHPTICIGFLDNAILDRTRCLAY